MAAISVLQAGGNAVDAAIGGTLAANVSEVAFTSLGGGGFLNVREPDGTGHVLDFFVTAPGLGSGERAEAADFTPVLVEFPGAEQEFHVGPGSVAVPGALAGFLTAHNRFGRAPLTSIVAPATTLARNGAVIEPVQAEVLELIYEILTLTPASQELIATDVGSTAGAGDVVRNPDLARFLRRIGEGEVDSIQSPAYAQPLLKLMNRTAGHVTQRDLEEYEVMERAPLEVERNGTQISLNARPAFGGAIIADALNRLLPAEQIPEIWTNTAAALQQSTAAIRLADLNDGIPHVSRGTTHISVVDSEGMIASMTTSNGSGSGTVIPGTGIHLNNMLGEEDLNPGGFHSIPPGLRLGSMMAPTILHQPDGSITGIGSGGSERIRSALLLALVRMIDLNMDVAQAICAPRLHPGPTAIEVEPGWSTEVIEQLASLDSVNIWPVPNLFFGGVHAVTRHGDGSVTAVGDSRRDGAAVVVPIVQ